MVHVGFMDLEKVYMIHKDALQQELKIYDVGGKLLNDSRLLPPNQ